MYTPVSTLFKNLTIKSHNLDLKRFLVQTIELIKYQV
jgi:hypothetical protein